MVLNPMIQIQSLTQTYHNACQKTRDLANKAKKTMILIQIMMIVVDKGAIEAGAERETGAKSKEQPLIH